jgi:hypothetical protein
MGFKSDPDPAFYLNADPDSQTKADPDLSQTLQSQKVELGNNIRYSYISRYSVQKAF